jgi:hypothetical protein
MERYVFCGRILGETARYILSVAESLSTLIESPGVATAEALRKEL